MTEVTQTTDPGRRQKLKVERFADGGIVCLKLAGTIDEEFDGKHIAAQIRADVVVLELAEIERISSFGIREWVDFVAALQARVGSLWFVECSPKVVDQFNMVANFGGSGHLVSFYAPFRCDYCDDDRRRLVRVAEEWEQIKTGKLPERACESCGNAEYFDEDPLTFFSFVQQHPPTALPDEVTKFLRERLNYVLGEGSARKLRVEKQIDGRATYLKLTGDLDGTFPTDKLAEGLEGDVLFDLTGIGRIDPAGAAEWRQLMARIAAPVDRILLAGCPAAFVERLTRAEDLAQKGVVLSFLVPYACASCRATTAREVDVGEHYEQLRLGVMPQLTCNDCGAAVTCAASDALLGHLPNLPSPDVSPELRALLARFRAAALQAELAQKSAGRAAPAPLTLPTAQRTAPGRVSWLSVLVALGIVLAAGGGVLVVQWLRHHGAPAKLEASQPTRPAWVDQTFFRDADRLMFVGRSTLLAEKGDGFEDGEHGALEEIAAQVGLSIRDPQWIDSVRGQYEPFRAKAVGDLEKATLAGEAGELERARRVVRQGRKRVAEALRKTAGTLVPAERADLYWEKLETPDGARYQVWIRYAVPKLTFEKLVESYTTPEEGMGARAVTYFPELAWHYDVVEGASIVKLAGDSPLRFAGVQEGDLVLSGMDRTVHDARSFRRVLDEEAAALAQNPAGGTLNLKVRRGDAPPVDTRLRIAAKVAPPTPGGTKPTRPGKPGTKPHGSGNIWDDNPDE